MIKLAADLEIPFERVVYGKYSVQLVVDAALHVFLQVDQHGAVLDFVAYYDVQHPEAKIWLGVLIRVVRGCIRTELQKSGCKVQPLSGQAPCCCHYHHPVSPDVIDCLALPLCPQCLLHETRPERHEFSGNLKYRECGHKVVPSSLCFETQLSSGAQTVTVAKNLTARVQVRKVPIFISNVALALRNVPLSHLCGAGFGGRNVSKWTTACDRKYHSRTSSCRYFQFILFRLR